MRRSEACEWLLKFTSGNDLDYEDCLKGYNKLSNVVEEYPDLSKVVIFALKSSLAFGSFCRDLSKVAEKILNDAIPNVDKEFLHRQCDAMLNKNALFIMRCVPHLLKAYPDWKDYLFTNAMKYCKTVKDNDVIDFNRAIVHIIKNSESEDNDVINMIKVAMADERVKWHTYAGIGEIYKGHPELSSQLIAILDDNLPSNRYGDFYNNLACIAIYNLPSDENTVYIDDSHPIDDKIPEKCLQLIEKHVTDDKQNWYDLLCLYKSAAQILKAFPQHENRIKNLINKGLEHSKNNKTTQKTAYRILDDYENLCSKVSIYLRKQADEWNEYGLEKTEQIDIIKPCVLVMGGDGVVDEKNLNGYLGAFYRLLKANALHEKVNVYGVMYDFGDYMNVSEARKSMMHQCGRHVESKEVNEETSHPKYVRDIFREFVEPRLSKDGRRLSEKEAIKNIRNLKIFAHCHGAYTVLMLENLMQDRMKELGYEEKSRERIQKQLLILAQAPYCPLGVSKSTMISFASVSDFEVSHSNGFEAALRALHKKEVIPFSYFPDKKGNLFLVDAMGRQHDDHNFWGFVSDVFNSCDANKMMVIEGNMLVNALKNTVEGNGRLGEVEDLVKGSAQAEKWFDEAKHNGTQLYKKMYAMTMAVAKYRAGGR